MFILIKNLQNVKKVIGSITKTILLISLGLITCTCSGLKSTWVLQTIEKQTDYSSYSGKLAKQIQDPMECAISKIDGVAFHSWHQQRLLTKLPSLQTLGLGYYQNLGLTPKKCLQIKSYQYPLITHSFLNRYRTVWIDLRPSWHIVYPPVNLRKRVYSVSKGPRSSKDWTPPSTGRIPETTRTTGRSLPSLSTMRPANGRGPRTSSTTGGLLKPPSGSVRE